MPSTRVRGVAAPSSHWLMNGGLGRVDLDDGAAAVARIGVALDEARAVEVGKHATDGGQGQSKPDSQLAHVDRAAAQLLKRGDVPRAQRPGRRRGGAVLPAPHPADDARKQLDQAQAQFGMFAAPRLVCHGAPLPRSP